MVKALYRKYRSKKLSEVVGQEHITKTLENAIKTDAISHAYLFTGPRGVGKTSIARILAHEINKLPYTDESIHMDIIEIDAASNRRIDEIRDLREKVHIAPTSAKYKVYIIDEVHMLTKEAFNALLKTLEEPPAHVVFILATTELHKLPETIVSRTQRFNFKAIASDAAVEHLKAIAKKEGINIDDDALSLVAAHGNGSFRDSISLLDQIGSHSKEQIREIDVETMLGAAGSERINQLLTKVQLGSPADILNELHELRVDGVNPSQIAKQLSRVLRDTVTKGTTHPIDVELLSDLLNISGSTEPSAELEVVLLRAYFSYNKTQESAAPQHISMSKVTPSGTQKVAKPKLLAIDSAPQKEQLKEKIEPREQSVNWWSDVLVQIKAINNTLYGIMRMAEPTINDNTLTLEFKFNFHKNKAADTSTLAKIKEIVTHVTGTEYEVKTVLNNKKEAVETLENSLEMPSPIPSSENTTVASISSIFGGAEVLET